MNGFIYKITNQVNGKVYIGQTRFTIEHRFKQHIKNFNVEHRKQPLYCAFAKYGLDKFKVEQLEECPVEDLDAKEIFWIAKYDSFKNGYNATLGGHSGCLHAFTDSQYEEIKDLYLSGFTTKRIALQFNVSAYTVIALLKSMNVKLRRQPFNINRIEKDLVIDKYKNGVSLTQLAKEYETDRECVKRFLVKEGVNLKDHSQISNSVEIQDALIKDFLNAVPYKELELKYKADTRTIKKILVIRGIDIKADRGFRHSKRTGFFLSPEKCLDVIDRYNKKQKVKSIAKYYDVNICTVYEILKKYNVKRNRYNHSKSVLSLKDNQG